MQRIGRFLRHAGAASLMLLVAAFAAASSAQSPDPLAPLPAAPAGGGAGVAGMAGMPDAASIAPPIVMQRSPRQDRLGYAFDHPEILARQRLIGLAHGLRLLGRVCLFDSAFSRQTEQAYADWYKRQSDAIDAMSERLERWYFGAAAPEPDAQLRLREVVRVLGLRSDLRPMTEAERHAACASFPQAIISERYDFARVLKSLDQEAAAPAATTGDVAPAGAASPAPPLPEIRK